MVCAERFSQPRFANVVILAGTVGLDDVRVRNAAMTIAAGGAACTVVTLQGGAPPFRTVAGVTFEVADAGGPSTALATTRRRLGRGATPRRASGGDPGQSEALAALLARDRAVRRARRAVRVEGLPLPARVLAALFVGGRAASAPPPSPPKSRSAGAAGGDRTVAELPKPEVIAELEERNRRLAEARAGGSRERLRVRMRARLRRRVVTAREALGARRAERRRRRAATAATMRIAPDLVYAFDEPMLRAACEAARRMSGERPRIAVDLPRLDGRSARGRRARRLASLLGAVDTVTVACEADRRRVVTLRPELSPAVVLSCPPPVVAAIAADSSAPDRQAEIVVAGKDGIDLARQLARTHPGLRGRLRLAVADTELVGARDALAGRWDGAALGAIPRLIGWSDVDSIGMAVDGAGALVVGPSAGHELAPLALAAAQVSVRVVLIGEGARLAGLVESLAAGRVVATAADLEIDDLAAAGRREAEGDDDAVGWRGQMLRLGEALGAPSAIALGDSLPRLAIGPRNGNGQATAWSEVLRRKVGDRATVETFAAEYETGPLRMPDRVDYPIPLASWTDRRWQTLWARFVMSSYTHVLLEQGLTACGHMCGRQFHEELPILRQAGLRVGLVFRGSEIRDPRRHVRRNPRWSPFRDPTDALTEKLQRLVDQARPHLLAFDGPVYVTTLDLLDDVPFGRWLPQVIDREVWRRGPEPLGGRLPRVLHAPSRERMKGSAAIDETCERLARQGAIEYVRAREVPFAEMPELIRSVDVVVDQMAIGSYGVLALQAMACGRLVVGHVAKHVRARVPGGLPIVEATADDLEVVLRAAVADRGLTREAADAGHAYVERFHDGRFSADQLAPFLLGEELSSTKSA